MKKLYVFLTVLLTSSYSLLWAQCQCSSKQDLIESDLIEKTQKQDCDNESFEDDISSFDFKPEKKS
jgi:hypothetical protein